jgi:hypothetical protein
VRSVHNNKAIVTLHLPLPASNVSDIVFRSNFCRHFEAPSLVAYRFICLFMSQLGPPCLLASPSGAVWSFAPPFRKPYSAEVVVPVASIATPPPALKVASSGTRVAVEEGWNRCKRACVSRSRFTCLGDNNKRVWVLRFRLWYCRTIHVSLLL